MREELSPWRKTSYCRCHELKCFSFFFQFQMEPTFYQHQYQRQCKNDSPCTIMPVSFAIISMRLYPCDTAFAACNITRVSNSSWLHMASADIQTRQRLAQDSPIGLHLHPELILPNLSVTEYGLSNGYWQIM